MAYQLAALLDNGQIQRFEFDKEDAAEPVKLGDRINPQIDSGNVVNAFHLEGAGTAAQITVIAGPPSGAWFTAHELNHLGASQKSFTVARARGVGVRRAVSGQRWLASSKGVFFWLSDDDQQFYAVAPQATGVGDDAASHSCYIAPYLLYANDQRQLVVHNVQSGATFPLKARRFKLPTTGPAGEDLNLSVKAIHAAGSQIAFLWASDAPIGGDPTKFVSYIVVSKQADFFPAVLRGDNIPTIEFHDSFQPLPHQLLGLYSDGLTSQFLLTGQPRGLFLRYGFDPVPNDPNDPPQKEWQISHTIYIDDLLATEEPPLHTHELRFVQSGA